MARVEASNRHRWRRVLAAACAGCLIVGLGDAVAAAGGSELFAAPNGSGTSCTSTTPCSLTQALSSAQDGDTVTLTPGTYTPPSTGNGFSASTAITVQGEAGSMPTIDALLSLGGQSGPSKYGLQLTKSGATVHNLAIQNAEYALALADDSTVSDVQITGFATGGASPTTGVTAGNGASISDSTITDVAIGISVGDDATMTSDQVVGALMYGVEAGVDASVSQVQISGTALIGFFALAGMTAGNTASIRDSTITNARTGITVGDDATLTNDQVTGAEISGIAAGARAKVSKAQISGAELSGLYEDAALTAGNSASISDSTVTNARTGISVGDDAKLTNDQVTGAEQYGIQLGERAAVSTVDVTAGAEVNGQLVVTGLSAGGSASISDSTFSDVGTGLSAGGNASISHSTFTHVGIGVSVSDHATLTNDRVTGANGGIGVRVSDDATLTNDQVTGVTGANGVPGFGVLAAPATGTTVTATGLDLSGNATALAMMGAGAMTVSASSIDDNSNGISVSAGSLLVNDGSTITGNTPTNGAAVGVGGGQLTLDGVAVSGTTGSSQPAAPIIVGGNGSLVLQDGSSVSHNTMTSGNAIGGIYALGGSVQLKPGTSVIDNTAKGYGLAVGGIFAGGGQLTIAGSTISNNTATDNGGEGAVGGIYEYQETGTISDSTVAHNLASASGQGSQTVGGILSQSSGGIERSTIAANTASGGDLNFGAVADTDDGTGGLVEQSTIVDNVSRGGTQHAAVYQAPLSASIVARSQGGDCAGVTDDGYNIDDDGSCGFSSAQHSVSDSAAIDDYLGQLADNGGPTQTVALLATPSPATTDPDPAVGAIPPDFVLPGLGVAACSTPDQRGVVPASGVDCSIGAYEAYTGPTVSWPQPAAITYGTPLSSTQLDAQLSVPGTCTYSPSAGTVLSAGTHTLSVTCTPTDTSQHAVDAHVSLTVNKASPKLDWGQPAAIAYGIALSSTQLDATANTPGTFTYTPPAGTVLSVGQHSLSVSFTPTDSADYTTATTQVSLTVTKATPVITWATPAAIAPGTPLSATQLDATASVPGTFTYTPAAGTVLPPGAHTLSVLFTPTDTADYTTASKSVQLVVEQPPSITSADHVSFKVGTFGSFTITTTGYPSGTSMHITSSTLPAGLSLADNNDGTATLAGTPDVGTGGVHQVTITADNGVAPAATQTLTITISEAPRFTTGPASITAVVGHSVSVSYVTAGYPTPTVTMTGTLPQGLSFASDKDTGSATITGIPAKGSGGVYHVTVSAGNGISPDASVSVTITIDEPPTITSANHATFVALQNNSFQVTATGGYPTGPITYTTTGPLPPGVTLSSDGALSGNPPVSASGYWTFTITASNGPTSTNQVFTLFIHAPKVATGSMSDPGGLNTTTLNATNGDCVSWALSGDAPYAPVTVIAYPTHTHAVPFDLGTYNSNANGKVTVSVCLPNTARGTYTLLAAGYALNGTVHYAKAQTIVQP